MQQSKKKIASDKRYTILVVDDEEQIRSVAPGAKTKFMAFLCKVCPFCIAARKFPESSFAKAMSKAEADCPACKAYFELYGAKDG